MAEAAAKKPTPEWPEADARADGPLADALNEGRIAKGARTGPSILGIEVEVEFVLGRAKVAVGTLMDLAQAHVLLMDTAPGDPVDVVVNGTRIAQGELVGGDADDPEAGDGLGVRITRICADDGSEGDADG